MALCVLALGGYCAHTAAAGAASGRRELPEDEKIWAYLSGHRDKMVRVTRKPVYVTWLGTELCARPNMLPHTPHGEHWIHVFVSPEGRKTMIEGKGVYPQGTYILKQKLLDQAGVKTDFYTGMRKREKGYHPELGDWEFFTLDSGGQMVTARGKIDSCIDCHKQYRSTDFVSRRYLAVPAAKG